MTTILIFTGIIVLAVYIWAATTDIKDTDIDNK